MTTVLEYKSDFRSDFDTEIAGSWLPGLKNGVFRRYLMTHIESFKSSERFSTQGGIKPFIWYSSLFDIWQLCFLVGVRDEITMHVSGRMLQWTKMGTCKAILLPECLLMET